MSKRLSHRAKAFHSYITRTDMIGIHLTPGGFSDRWIEYCESRHLTYQIIDCLASDVIQQCERLDFMLWHWPHHGYREQLIARAVIASLEHKGIKVFPSTATCWHYDDKVAQKYLLEAIGAPLIPTWVFTSRSDAMTWIGQATWPKVFKLRGGAGSSNVRLVRSRTQAESLCQQAFTSGFPAVPGYFNDMSARLRKTKNLEHLRERLLRAPSTFHRMLQSRLYAPRQRGYIYFQEFLPNNPFDTRITIIGNRAFGFRRVNRPADFRASGSGVVHFNPDDIDKRCLTIAFDVCKRLGSQSLEFDFLFGPNNDPMIGEVSYCYRAEAVHACPGHWNQDLDWQAGSMWPQDAILDDMLAILGQQRGTESDDEY